VTLRRGRIIAATRQLNLERCAVTLAGTFSPNAATMQLQDVPRDSKTQSIAWHCPRSPTGGDRTCVLGTPRNELKDRILALQQLGGLTCRLLNLLTPGNLVKEDESPAGDG
jgi:hypothetical protein